jgi:hypothetical protein
VLVTVIVAFVAGHFVWTRENTITKTKLLPPDTPPAEYLYLDSDRVLAYLGQIENGLPASAKRTLSERTSANAAVKGGLIAEISGSTERQTSIEETVTPAATDRFFSLLIKLRSGRSENRKGEQAKWLHDESAVLDPRTEANQAVRRLASIHEGDFVRLTDAHLFLPRFAALAPRARYAAELSGEGFSSGSLELGLGSAADVADGVDRYLEGLGADPVLPFVIPTRIAGSDARSPITFFAPARYSGLLDNARLLSGNLTVVGKVTYVDRRSQDDPACAAQTADEDSPCTYVDRQAAATYAPALESAPRVVRRLVGIRGDRVATEVSTAMRLTSPLVVLLPVAIYQ